MRLAEYLHRLGSEQHVAPTLESLRRLHVAHRETFAFENLTIQSGGGISLMLADLERKFLDEGRGGYCFEHNTLFAAALAGIGFRPATLLGRVRRGPPERWCRTHMVLRVPVDDEPWLADVGFGAIGTLEPLPLRDGARSTQTGFEYRVAREGHLWVLSVSDAAADTQDLYEFSDDPQTPWDVEVANHFTSTHPESAFRRTLTIQRSGRTERLVLRGETLERYRDGRVEVESIDRRDWPRLARELFEITLPAGPYVCDAFNQVET
jgi:N-hydroxyarylamine O-acetyltransferase